MSNRWVTEREFARIHGLNKQSLANWRYKDRLAGRSQAEGTYPKYKRFGRAVRYRIEQK